MEYNLFDCSVTEIAAVSIAAASQSVVSSATDQLPTPVLDQSADWLAVIRQWYTSLLSPSACRTLLPLVREAVTAPQDPSTSPAMMSKRLLFYGVSLIDAGKLDEAIEVLRRSISADASNKEAYVEVNRVS